MEPIARGRDADVYAVDGGRVLRRYREGGDAEPEARLMRHLTARGYPVPRVYDAAGTDLVLERVQGPTMLQELARRPWLAGSYGRMLGALHDRLHELPAPPWLPRRFATGAGRDRVLHLDLHPDNVVLAPGGPVVIDWRTAGAGDPAADLAMTLVTVGGVEIPGLALRAGRGRLLRGVRRASATDPAPRLVDAARAKLRDPHLSPVESAWLRRRIAGVGGHDVGDAAR